MTKVKISMLALILAALITLFAFCSCNKPDAPIESSTESENTSNESSSEAVETECISKEELQTLLESAVSLNSSFISSYIEKTADFFDRL